MSLTIQGGSVGMQKSSPATKSPPCGSTRKRGSSGWTYWTLQLLDMVSGSNNSATLVMSWLWRTHTSRTATGNESTSSSLLTLTRVLNSIIWSKIIYSNWLLHLQIFSTFWNLFPNVGNPKRWICFVSSLVWPS